MGQKGEHLVEVLNDSEKWEGKGRGRGEEKKV